MRITIIRESHLEDFLLPELVDGNYWVFYTDKRGKSKELVNVVASDNAWVMKQNEDVSIINLDGTESYEQVVLQTGELYFLRLADEKILLYVSNFCDDFLLNYNIVSKGEITIGQTDTNTIVIPSPLVRSIQAKLVFDANHLVLQSTGNGVYLNRKAIINRSVEVVIGDIVFIYGFKIIYMGSFFAIQNPKNQVLIRETGLEIRPQEPLNVPDQGEPIDLSELELYKEEDYFYQSPRLRSSIEKREIKIDAPPAKQEQGKMPWIFTVGPMLTMACTSIMSGYVAIMGLIDGTRSKSSAIPSLVMCFTMLFGTILLPMLSRRYQRQQKEKREKFRQSKYRKYLFDIEQQIDAEMKKQTQILNEIYLPLEICENIIMTRKRVLWERRTEDNDFLSIRLGLGIVPAEIDVKAPEQSFTLDEDNLMAEVNKVVYKSRELINVPVGMNLAQKNIVAIMGLESERKIFISNMLLQLITFHSYMNLKIVFLMDGVEEEEYSFAKVLPHCWDNNKEIHFFAANVDEMKSIDSYLQSIIEERKDSVNDQSNKVADYHNFAPYYLIITNHYKSVKNLGIIHEILKSSVNLGFSFLILTDLISELPKECETFLDILEKTSGLVENELISTKQKQFTIDHNLNINLEHCSQKLANIPIMAEDENSNLPGMITFLEMYGVGMVEQLNSANTWKMNDPTASLSAPIGVYAGGELFKLDLHEKQHGPHGLIAGSTGSGKSEFIITYVLSMAVNYHPDEVQFVLIDYKGGGLAGAFENRETGIRLPHLAGTITNLDTVEMNRSLASIQSELRRRQRMFNEAREELDESTIDIYKYQKLYRQGLVEEPMSHLFIISDEFAELKQQQPEFMQQLISTARIGRSLGVHLILATQKPSGVVNDQIWSNSKFKVCLKVQEKADSMDMIKRPDAAMLKETGRFYLQVGYNEYFALGQSAWCGAKYYPSERLKRKVDDSILFVDRIGSVIKTMSDAKKQEKILDVGEQLPNIVKYLIGIAEKEEIHVRQLWLDRIPDVIYIEDLKKKYGYQKESFVLNPIVGEFDDPNNQRQGLLTLPLSTGGHTSIYGITGSGKENLLSTVIYSLVTTYTVREVNIYILDLGAETLKMFASAPQVGDVATTYDKEKITNLFKMAREEIETRKDLFNDYNGDYQTYCRESGSSVPNFVVVINNFAAFLELYSELEEDIVQLTREGLKYGVIFMITATNVNTIRYKLAQNIGQKLVLQLNDNSEYTGLVGRTNGIFPSRVTGRGLVRLEDVYEFQTAYISDSISKTVKETIDALQTQIHEKARSIPVLPQVVTVDFLKAEVRGLNNMPIGVSTDELSIVSLDLKKNFVNIITALDISITEKFIYGFTDLLLEVGETLSVVVDIDHNFSKENFKNSMYFSERVDEIYQFLEEDIVSKFNMIQSGQNQGKSNDDMKQVVCTIVGFSKFYESLNPTKKKNFSVLMKSASMIKKYAFIFVDTAEGFKKIAYESWYREYISGDDGLWIGSGVSNQMTIRLNKTTKEMREEINNSFGFLVKKGNPRLIKVLEKDGSKEEEHHAQ